MKKLVAALVAVVAAALSLAAPTTAVAATYPPIQCDVQVSPAQVRPGQQFTVTVTADQRTTLTATYRNVTKRAENARRLVAQFTAPRVSTTQTTRVTTTCNGNAGSVADVLVVAGDGVGPASGGTDGVADADADAGDANGILPGTGGTDFWLLVLGVLLVVAGAGAVVARRRRNG